MIKASITTNQQIATLAGVFAQWYMLNNQQKTIEEFLEESHLKGIFSRQDILKIINEDAYINDDALPLLKDVLPFKISLPKLNKLNFMAKTKENAIAINIDANLFYTGKIGKILERKQKANNRKKNWRAKNPNKKYTSTATPTFEANQQRKLIRNADNKIFKLTKPEEYQAKRDIANQKATKARQTQKQTNKETYKQTREKINAQKRERKEWLKENDPQEYQRQLAKSNEAKKRYRENKKIKIAALVQALINTKTY